MKAVTFDVTVPSYLITKGLGRLTEAVTYGALSRVQYRDVELPALPGDDWVRLDILKAGICGTDIGTLTFKTTPTLEPFGSFPAVLGHEVLARVAEVGPAVRKVEVGQRVAVDPMISCTMRGHTGDAQCPSCRDGHHCTCARAGDEGTHRIGNKVMQPGMTVGYHENLPGGWGEQMLAHESQLFAVDDALSDRRAVLIEPLSIGLHAVLNVRPFVEGPILVIGSGPIALGTIWALRAAGFAGEIVAQVKRSHEAEIARALGASSHVGPGSESRAALIATGARGYKPTIGEEVFAGGGFPLIFDCVGNGKSLAQCLRYAAARGRIVMLGCAAEISRIDMSLLWARELDVKGFVGYGQEEWRGQRVHTFQVCHDMLIESGAPVDRMITHSFSLDRYREALSTAGNRRKTGSIKVLLEPASST